MSVTTQLKMINEFMKDVDKGLSKEKKSIPSKYFYDKNGDALFVKIMKMPEYYLTRAEHEILKENTALIIDSLKLQKETYFEFIELGAGDGTKTMELLRALIAEGFNFDYLPVDISENALFNLKASLAFEIPDLQVKTQQGDYFEVLSTLKESSSPKVVLFLGSNLGNLTDEDAGKFIYQLGSNLNHGDKVLLGVDLIKSRDIVLPAYDDATGITKSFNLNLLTRINRELDADFDTAKFNHISEYDVQEGIVKSFLVSSTYQKVTIGRINKSYVFEKDERIHTEISRKYNDTIMKDILSDTDFKITNKLSDSKNYFANYILTRQ
ncbi:MAG: L-histidine N(alpha)-methyltransferase [Aquaticitalea sp.]